MKKNTDNVRRNRPGSRWTTLAFHEGIINIILLLAACVLQSHANATDLSDPIQAFQRRLIGPILTFPTPFTASDTVDYDGVRRMIGQALEYEEVHAVTLTAGNNQFQVLTFDEVKELTRVMVDAAGTRALSIASTGFWEKNQVLDYARFAEVTGASAVQVLKPVDTADADVAAYFRDLAEATRLPIVLHGEFSPELLRELIKIPSIAAMKEDAGLDYLIARQIEFGDRLVIFPGGFDSRVLVGYPYGVRAYYTVFYQFAPELGHQFWQCLERGDIRAAGDFVKKYDYPFAQKWTYPRWVATCAYFGMCKSYVRPAEKSLNEAQRIEIKSFWDGLGVQPDEGTKNSRTQSE